MSHFNSVFKSNELLFSNPYNAVTSRTTFDRSHTHKTTLDSGLLVPIYLDEVLPGDTHIINMSYMSRMSTPLVPIADNAVLDFSFFFVPTRLLWSQWKNFMGETDGYWAQNNYPLPPRVYYDTNVSPSILNSIFRNYGGYRQNDLAVYLGLPAHTLFLGDFNSKKNINQLPFWAYSQVWNDWFRDENYQSPIYWNAHNASNTGANVANVTARNPLSPEEAKNYNLNDDPYAIVVGLGLMSVSKLPDYFTTCLPAPQKGDPVVINTVAGNSALNLEVVNRNLYNTRGTNQTKNDMTDFRNRVNANLESRQAHTYQFLFTGNRSSTQQGYNRGVIGFNIDSNSFGGNSISNWSSYEVAGNTFAGTAGYMIYPQQWPRQLVDGVPVTSNQNQNDTAVLYHDMVAKLPANVIQGQAININDLRLAFAVQQFLETDARGGTRYIEILKNHFGVISPDARLQRSEYLGGFRDYLNVQQVLATAQNEAIGQQVGTAGAIALNNGATNEAIVYSATEHGFIMGFVTVRVLHTYGQGVEKLWTRMSRYDYYWPVFDALGEQPVYKREIYAGPSSSNDWNEVFGYNEPYAEYRWAKNRVSGAFNPGAGGANQQNYNYLSLWAFTDNYSQRPTLNANWIKENSSNIQQTLGFGTNFINQFLFDFYFDVKSTRPMSMYGIPGLTRM